MSTNPADHQFATPRTHRSNTDGSNTTVPPLRATQEDFADFLPQHKTRLYELFSLIEREFDALYNENQFLRARVLDARGEEERLENPLVECCPIDDSPKDDERFTVEEQLPLAGSNHSDTASKGIITIEGRARQARHQKWKTAFAKGPPGRLVTTLKANAGEGSKHRAVRCLRGHQDGVWHVASSSSPSGQQLVATASADQTARIWSADDGKCLAAYRGHGGSVNSISIRAARDDSLHALTTGGDRTAHIWRLSTEARSDDSAPANFVNQGDGDLPQIIQQPLARLVGHSDVVVSGEWLLGGDQVLTASWDRTANIYDVESGKVLNILSGHDQELTHCNTSGAQKLVATASRDFTFRLWDFREPIQSVAVFQGHNGSVTSVVFTALHHIVSGSDDRAVKVWDLRNMRSPITTIRLNSSVNRLAMCNKHHLLAVPQDSRHVSVYDLSGSRVARLPRNSGKFCHTRMVSCAAWLTDHTTNNLFSCGFDKQVIGWRVQLPTK